MDYNQHINAILELDNPRNTNAITIHTHEGVILLQLHIYLRPESIFYTKVICLF